MPNIATAIRDEIRRLAKREIKSATQSTRQTVTQHRRDIAMLKRLVHVQQKEIRFLQTQESKGWGEAPPSVYSIEFHDDARPARRMHQDLGPGSRLSSSALWFTPAESS